MTPKTRRQFFKQSIFAATAFSIVSCSTKKRRPNIILIMADDLGYGDLRCYGSEWINTPNIDMLADKGVRFTDYHSNGAVCTPTRAALLTGRYQQRSGLEGVIYVKPPTRSLGMAREEITFAESLKAAGYSTCLVGKWHLGYEKMYNPANQGFDEFRGYVSGNVDYISHYDNAGYHDWWHNLERVEEEGYSTDLITKHAVNYIHENKARPFCLYVAHESPHWPYQGRSSKADRYDGSTTQEIPGHGLDPDPKARFKEMIEVMDGGVGDILKTLRDLNLEKDTFVFFCSDNGGDRKYASNGVLRGTKGTLWEGGHRVPAIAYWPGRIKSGETDATVMSMDLFPTLASIANAAPPTYPLDGIDISQLLFKKEPLQSRTLFWRYRKQKAVRRDQWKLLVDGEKIFLFDLNNDIGEMENLAEKEPTVASELFNALVEWELDVPSQDEQKTV
jgi:arylsulfatase A